MTTRLETIWRAWGAEQLVYGYCWDYLPPQMMQNIRAWYRPRLLRAVEQLPLDSGPLTQVLIELMELVV